MFISGFIAANAPFNHVFLCVLSMFVFIIIAASVMSSSCCLCYTKLMRNLTLSILFVAIVIPSEGNLNSLHAVESACWVSGSS